MAISAPLRSLASPPFVHPEPLDLSFEGFTPEAFAVLERLREEPHVERYRQEKDGFRRWVQEPFKRYRDDLVVNWVLPNRLPFETEKNVFSRILKNDFGAGGAHHHLWMAFYRPPRKRLVDIQLSHALYPDQFACGLYVGAYAKGLFPAARERMRTDEALRLLNDLIRRGYVFRFAPRVRGREADPRFDAPLEAMPPELGKAQGIWVRRAFSREQVLAWGPELVRHALTAQADLWPLYRFWLEAAHP
ncbi:MAG: hypothetical protein HKN04_07205 [Rhodothermaceae bacterium]|nr:hypothetical protein [Rhodothermaceae bacterium]